MSFKIVIQDVDAQSALVELSVRSWTQVHTVKSLIRDRLQIPVECQRLFFGGQELRGAQTLIDHRVQAGSRLLLSVVTSAGDRAELQSFAADRLRMPSHLADALEASRKALAIGLRPQLTLDGTGGTYLLRDVNKRVVSIFKPSDEEPFAPHNPRGFVGRLGQAGFRDGIPSGEACYREVAAFLIDTDGFFDVPATVRAEARHPAFSYSDGGAAHHVKIGSLQEFVEHEAVVADMGTSKLPVHQVQKIALLDMMLFNLDRNDANMLVKRGPDGDMILVPIDHGYTLPRTMTVGWCDWCWLDWPQLKEPVTPACRDYVNRLEPHKVAQDLADLLPIDAECLRVFCVTSTILKIGIEADMTLYEIANYMCRQDLDVPSRLETLFERASSLSRAVLGNTRLAPDSAAAAVCEASAPAPALRRSSTTGTDDDILNYLSSASRTSPEASSSDEVASPPARPLPGQRRQTPAIAIPPPMSITMAPPPHRATGSARTRPMSMTVGPIAMVEASASPSTLPAGAADNWSVSSGGSLSDDGNSPPIKSDFLSFKNLPDDTVPTSWSRLEPPRTNGRSLSGSGLGDEQRPMPLSAVRTKRSPSLLRTASYTHIPHAASTTSSHVLFMATDADSPRSRLVHLSFWRYIDEFAKQELSSVQTRRRGMSVLLSDSV